MLNVVKSASKSIVVPIEVSEFLINNDRRIASQARKDRRYLSYQSVEDALEYKSYSNDDLLDHLIKKETLNYLRVCISKLTDDEKTLIYLKYEERQTHQTISSYFGISKMAVTKRLRRIEAKLRGGSQEIDSPTN